MALHVYSRYVYISENFKVSYQCRQIATVSCLHVGFPLFVMVVLHYILYLVKFTKLIMVRSTFYLFYHLSLTDTMPPDNHDILIRCYKYIYIYCTVGVMQYIHCTMKRETVSVSEKFPLFMKLTSFIVQYSCWCL